MNEMPSVLVESAFMMIPEQEAALRTPDFRRRIAEGVAAGIERFLSEGRTEAR
jgi:N-acetylmuramoyl-L-alanine amidase